jgi:uncharacterized protein
MTQNNTQSGSRTRGFASMDSTRQREIASMGGKAAHEKGTAHTFTSSEAQEAGRKGGKASHGKQESQREQDRSELGQFNEQRDFSE